MGIEALQHLPASVFIFVVVLVAIFGACIGSFLNVVIYRLPIMLQQQWQAEARSYLEVAENDKPEKVFNLAVPRSACPVCSAQIKAWQNIPVVSYLLLRGKCYSCKTPISIRYPVVEMIAAALTLVLFFRYGFEVEFFALSLLTYVSMGLFGIDVDHQLLPDDMTLPLLWLGLILNSQSLFVSLHVALFGAVFGYGVLWAVFWLFKFFTGKEGMGYGDFKLLAAYGAWFGWSILPNVILLSSLVGSLVGGWLILRKGHNSQTPISFGPFIIVAGWLTAIYPEQFTLMNFIR